MPSSRKVLACATVIEEMLPLLPPDVSYEVLDFGLHVNPQALKQALREAIDRAAGSADVDVIILGYGFCSMAVMGLRANGCTLVVPRVDDCIASFFGVWRRLQTAGALRARHLLSHKGLDRGRRHAIFGIRSPGRAAWREEGEVADEPDAQALHAPGLDRHRTRQPRPLSCLRPQPGRALWPAF